LGIWTFFLIPWIKILHTVFRVLKPCITICFSINGLCFQLAQQHAKMDLFADIVGDDASPEDYHRYFELVAL
jgi:hypothetical protein